VRFLAGMVVVISAKVPNPVAVCYAWEHKPECNWPITRDSPPPFRGDDFVNFFTREAE
jgi:hypothetical protein